MYTVVSAIAQLHAPGSPFVGVNLDAATLSEIDNAYSEVYLHVRNPFWTEDRTMQFRDRKSVV